MRLFGAIDVFQGACVRMLRGERLTARKYFKNPLDAVAALEDAGADAIHVVDLDAAFGARRNIVQVLKIIRRSSLPVQVGGGMRGLGLAREVLDAGAERVVVSTLLSEDPAVVRTMCDEFGGRRVAAAIDVKAGKALANGWTTRIAATPPKLAALAAQIGVGALVYTDASRDGTLAGLNEGKLKRFISSVRLPVIVAGGVSSAADAEKARSAGASGLIVGKAFYEGKFDFMEAGECLRKG